MWDKIFANPANLAVFMALCIPIVSVIAYYWHETLKNRSVVCQYVGVPDLLQPFGKLLDGGKEGLGYVDG